MTEFASPVLFSGRVKETVAFYRALGVPLADEDHDDGPVHFAADMPAGLPHRGCGPGRAAGGGQSAGSLR